MNISNITAIETLIKLTQIKIYKLSISAIKVTY